MLPVVSGLLFCVQNTNVCVRFRFHPHVHVHLFLFYLYAYVCDSLCVWVVCWQAFVLMWCCGYVIVVSGR